MADFCSDCAARLGVSEADILADPGEIVWDLCEGCGLGWFDEHGRRVPTGEAAAPDGPQPC